jgi:hypothetical protein
MAGTAYGASVMNGLRTIWAKDTVLYPIKAGDVINDGDPVMVNSDGTVSPCDISVSSADGIACFVLETGARNAKTGTSSYVPVTVPVARECLISVPVASLVPGISGPGQAVYVAPIANQTSTVSLLTTATPSSGKATPIGITQDAQTIRIKIPEQPIALAAPGSGGLAVG